LSESKVSQDVKDISSGFTAPRSSFLEIDAMNSQRALLWSIGGSQVIMVPVDELFAVTPTYSVAKAAVSAFPFRDFAEPKPAKSV